MSQATLDALDFFIPANNLGYVNLSEGTVGAIGSVTSRLALIAIAFKARADRLSIYPARFGSAERSPRSLPSSPSGPRPPESLPFRLSRPVSPHGEGFLFPYDFLFGSTFFYSTTPFMTSPCPDP